MNTEKEFQLEAMSFKDMASYLLPTTELEALMIALEEQEAIMSASPETEANDPLLDSFEEIRKQDPKLAFIFVQEIANFITSKAFKPEDIPKLVHSISYAPEMAANIQANYTAKGMMSWTDFGINVHAGSMAKNPDGTPAYNVGHFFDHEISHSLIESEAITMGQIKDMFEDSNITFESKHVQNLANDNADPVLLLKERFSEVSSCYLQSFSDSDHMMSFIEKMIMNSQISDENELQTNKDEMIESFRTLYNKLEQVWPSISKTVNETSFEEVYEMAQSGSHIGLEIEENELPTSVPQPIGPFGGDSGSDETLKNMKNSRTFEETSDLARNNKSESFGAATKNFLRDFAEGLNPFSGGMAA